MRVSRLLLSLFVLSALVGCDGAVGEPPPSDTSGGPSPTGLTTAAPGDTAVPGASMTRPFGERPNASSMSGGVGSGGVRPGGPSLPSAGGMPAGGEGVGEPEALPGPAEGGAAGAPGSPGQPPPEDTPSAPSDASSDGGAPPAACPRDGWAPGDHEVTLAHDGLDREYEVHVPPGYTGTTSVPLMLVIHGAHNTPRMARSWSQMDPVADENGFIVVYPAGVDCWNTGFVLPGCTAADDDVGFLTSVVADVAGHACIDPKRVYATGISNGAMMAQTLGCEEADIFAAVGGVAGPAGARCSPSRPITVTYFHGTADSTVGYSSAEPTFTGWADRNGCTGQPVETYNRGSTTCRTYQECEGDVEVLFCAITGMGHCWPEDTRCIPQQGAGVDDFEASPMMWEYFARHRLP